MERPRRLVPKVGNAVAASMSIGFEEGLKRIEALGASSALDQYYLFQPARVVILLHMSCQPSTSQAAVYYCRLSATIVSVFAARRAGSQHINLAINQFRSLRENLSLGRDKMKMPFRSNSIRTERGR